MVTDLWLVCFMMAFLKPSRRRRRRQRVSEPQAEGQIASDLTDILYQSD